MYIEAFQQSNYLTSFSSLKSNLGQVYILTLQLYYPPVIMAKISFANVIITPPATVRNPFAL